MQRQKSSTDSLAEATRNRASFSGHGNAKGAAGYINPDDVSLDCDFLTGSGQSLSVSAPESGFGNIGIGVAWNRMETEEKILMGFARRKKLIDVDLDLGCLYELKDGSRGSLQPFGDLYGALDRPPFIHLTGDEREGDKEGHDEYMTISGLHWNEVKRILIYVYIYDGTPDWASIRPQIHIHVPGEKPMIVTLQTPRGDMRLCALTGLENVRGGIRIVNYTEYYPGHAEMDRAHGFGIKWTDGQKSPAR